MATVLPLRPSINSTGSSTNSRTRHPSLNSFPASVRSATHSTNADSINAHLAVKHQHSHSNASQHSRGNSHHSALSGGAQSRLPRKQQRNVPRHVKSQYPAESSEKHVEYILVASFDIDRGSIMEHQYPGPVGGDEHMLAELMLPDQAHVRSQDWTIFFLHKDAGAEDDSEETKHGESSPKSPANGEGGDQEADGSDEEQDFGEHEAEKQDYSTAADDSDDPDDFIVDGPPLIYVLNLVNTKHDNTIKRGAIVKAMAICTRHSFLHIYKPLLLLALEQYFANPVVETLASLYDAVNSMDLSLLPRLNSFERSILQASDAKDLFVERFETIIAQRMAEKQELDSDAPVEMTNSTQTQSKPRFGLPRDTHEFESVIRYANVPVPVKVPTAVSAETVGDFSLIKLINTFSSTHAQSVVAFNPTHPHLTTSGPNTHPIIVLLNAMLTQKRVIFLGHNQPSSEVAEAVLAACALASGGMLRGYTRHAFPYTDLTKIDDLLKVPGFIAGVTNPAFAHKTEWWDLLCDLSTGRMRISNHIEQAPLTEGVVFFQQNTHQLPPHLASGQTGISALMSAGATLSAGLGGNATPSGSVTGDPTGDGAFMHSVLAAINERHGENAIRSKFRRWVLKFTRLAASFEETVYGASALHIHNPESPPAHFPPVADSPVEGSRDLSAEAMGHGYVWASAQARNNELAANATRIEGWRNTRSYYNFVQDLASHYSHRPIKHLDLEHLHDKLAKLRLGNDQSANIYLALCGAIQTEQEISQLLSTVANGVWENKPNASSAQLGLLYIGTGLFHSRVDVREEVAELLGRIKEHEAGRHFWHAMGRFMKIAWERIMAVRVDRTERLQGAEDIHE